MADFIDFEAEASDASDGNDKMEVDNSTNLIDNAEVPENNDPSFFRFFNQTRDIDKVLGQVAEEETLAVQNMEASNYNEYDNEETVLDDFEKSEIRREIFLQTLKNPVAEQTKENSFYSALLFAIKFIKTTNSNFCEEEELKEKIGQNLYMELHSKRDMCVLNLNKKDFDYMCFWHQRNIG